MRTHVIGVLLLMSLLAGCADETADTSGPAHDDLGLSIPPTLYLNLTVGNDTHRFSSDSAVPGHAGHGNATNTTSASATTTVASGNSTGNSTGAGNATGPGGLAPLNVSVTLGAKGLPTTGTVSWTLTFGDETASLAAANATGNATAGNSTKASAAANGTKLPATANHTYALAGSFNLTFTVLRGNTTLAHLVVGLDVANGTGTGLAPGTVVGTLLFDQTGTLTVAVQELSCDTAHGVGPDASFEWEFPAQDANGTPVVVSHVLITLAQGDGNFDSSLHFTAPDGTTSSADDNSFGGGSSEMLDLEGPYAAGVYTVKVVGCVSANGDFTLHGEATLVAA